MAAYTPRPILTTFVIFNLLLVVIGAGTQFITGPCTSDADCASSCCGFNSGLCAGPIIAQERDGGCGHGDAQPNDNAAVALGFTGQVGGGASSAPSTPTTLATIVSPSPSPIAAAASPAGTQFITGACSSDADCASSCCGFNSGLCAGAIIAQERDGGCGHGDAQPNDTAAKALGFTGQVGGGSSAAVAVAAAGATTATAASVATSTGSGKAPGTQFITGVCGSDADCASGCCGFKSGKCAGAIVAQERDGGCGFGDAEPNDTAAVALGFTGQVGQK